MYCWICDIEMQKYILLPEVDNTFQIPNKKDTYEIKIIDSFTFLYYTVCYECMDKYLDNYPFDIRKLHKREIHKV